jgi:hypothetical protein
MITYLLIVLAVKAPTFGPVQIDVNTVVFKDSARCLRNVINVKKQLKEKQYDQVNVECVERKLEE